MKITATTTKNECMKQPLKSVPVGNSSGDIHLHTAFALTSSLDTEIAVTRYYCERTGPILSYYLTVEIVYYFMFHRKYLDP